VLLRRLLERIDAAGPLPWSAFVEAALYDPAGGFYTGAGRAGRRADFLTSPEVGPLFGAVVARALDTWWEAAGEPADFTLVEGGAGPGTLARSVLAAGPRCGSVLRYLAVERSANQRSSHPAGVMSVGDWPAEPVGVGVVIANELLDNLPFDLVEARDARWWEVRVGRRGDTLVEVLGGPAPAGPAWSSLPDPGAVPDGVRLPVQTAARAWVERARATVTSGRVVAVDYAARSDELVALPAAAWLRTTQGHAAGGDPLVAPGSADITVPVVIDQLPPPDEVVGQAEFLRRHGIDALVAEGRAAWTARASVADLAALAARSRIREAEALLDPAGLGGFTVLTWNVHGNHDTRS
jgi:SAM-dependent MidA family methyltransferase